MASPFYNLAMRRLVPFLALALSCSALRHTERVEVLNPHPLADTQIARLAYGGKIQYNGERWTFRGVEDSSAILTRGRKALELPLDSLRGRELVLSTSRLSGAGCLLGGALGLLVGGGAGFTFFTKTQEDLEQSAENAQGCGAAFAFAIAAAVILGLALIIGAAIAILAAVGGSLCLSGVFGAKKVQALKERAEKLREALK